MQPNVAAFMLHNPLFFKQTVPHNDHAFLSQSG